MVTLQTPAKYRSTSALNLVASAPVQTLPEALCMSGLSGLRTETPVLTDGTTTRGFHAAAVRPFATFQTITANAVVTIWKPLAEGDPPAPEHLRLT